MTLSGLVDPAQRWRVANGMVPDCPVGTIVALATNGDRLEVSRPWYGIVAQLDLRTATIRASTDGRELVVGTATGEVVFENQQASAPVPAAVAPSTLGAAGLVGKVVRFGAAVPNADGWNLFVFLVLRRLDGWLIGLTQNGHPAGIAETNIAWAQVVDPGPRTTAERLILTYVGSRAECAHAYASEAPTLRELGYAMTTEHFRQEPRNPATVIVALLLTVLLAFVLVGFAILVWLIVAKPPGVLTVTFERVRA